MRLIDKYLFRQFLAPTLAAAAALTALAVLSQALSAIGIMLDQRQSPLVFAKIVLLATPQMVVLVLPVAVLLAGLLAANRLHAEHEIAICFTGGMSRWRVAAPAVRLAALLATACLAVNLWLQPLCFRTLRETLQAAREDVLASLLRPGQFTHPGPGVTVFVQSIDDEGNVHNLFIDRRLPSGRDTTITAQSGRLIRHVGAPVILMRHGANEELTADGRLNFLSFDQYTLDLRAFMAPPQAVRYKLSDRYLHELIFPDPADAWAQLNRGPMLAEANARLATPLYNPAFALLAVGAMLGGTFRRSSRGALIAGVFVLGLLARGLGFAVEAAASGRPALNGLQYAVPVGVALGALIFLLRTRASPARRASPDRLGLAAP